MKWGRIFVGILLAVAVTGCSAPPDREEADARAALRKAHEADAEIYAALEYTLAQDEFDRALAEKNLQSERFKPLRSFAAAKEGFISARELAAAALVAAKENLSLRAQESQSLFDQAQRALSACSDTLAGAPAGSGKGIKVDLAVFRDDILILTEEWENIRPYLVAGRFDLSDSLSQSVSRRATALQEEIITAAATNRR